MIIGVTGGVGTGKSTILNLLQEEFHAAVIISDDVARDLMNPGEEPYDEIVKHFGADILTCGAGSPIDRNLLARKVFADPEELQILNSMVHPAVRKEILALIAKYQSEGYPLIVIETAILIEAGYRSLVDELWVVHTDLEIRYARLQASRNYSREKTDIIIQNQMPAEELEAMADWIIDNSTDLENVRKQLQEHLQNAGNLN